MAAQLRFNQPPGCGRVLWSAGPPPNSASLLQLSCLDVDIQLSLTTNNSSRPHCPHMCRTNAPMLLAWLFAFMLQHIMTT